MRGGSKLNRLGTRSKLSRPLWCAACRDQATKVPVGAGVVVSRAGSLFSWLHWVFILGYWLAAASWLQLATSWPRARAGMAYHTVAASP